MKKKEQKVTKSGRRRKRGRKSWFFILYVLSAYANG
jgi:hypothetical protein